MQEVYSMQFGRGLEMKKDLYQSGSRVEEVVGFAPCDGLFCAALESLFEFGSPIGHFFERRDDGKVGRVFGTR